MVVFKPFDRAYERDPCFFQVKGLDKCRKLFKRPTAYIMTREIIASKIHVNSLVATTENLIDYHDSSYCSKYKVHVSELHNLGDRQRVLVYITKEGKKRTFIKYLDYIVYSKI